MRLPKITASIALAALAGAAAAQSNRVDGLRPDAPLFAAPGDLIVGVTTLRFLNPGQPDVAQTEAEGEVPVYDRPLTIELWYPAAEGTQAGGTYETMLRDGVTPVTLTGQAARDAMPLAGEAYPLIILSHGFPGNRHLMAHLGENLASKGYIVASIDHTDSTYSDQAAFGSTLVNRPIDQRFVIDQLAALDGDLGLIIDASRAAVVGYSMGGYGALVYAGAGVTEISTTYEWGAPQGLLQRHMMGTATHGELADPRVRAYVAIGPWGMNAGFWNAEGLAGIDTPLMLIAGEVDDVSGYPAIREIFEGTTGTTRHLLTFEGANHNAAAPIPSPAEGYVFSELLDWYPFEHYADPVWDNVRMNNITQHFTTAFLDLHLKGDVGMQSYLDLTPVAAEGLWSVDDEGVPTADHSYWEGFPNRTAVGLQFESLLPEE